MGESLFIIRLSTMARTFSFILTLIFSITKCGSADPVICQTTNLTISTQADLEAVQSCYNISNRFHISDFTGNFTLPNLEHANGFDISDPGHNLTSISFPNLRTSQNLSLQGLQGLQSVNFPELWDIGDGWTTDGNWGVSSNWIRISDLPSIKVIDFSRLGVPYDEGDVQTIHEFGNVEIWNTNTSSVTIGALTPYPWYSPFIPEGAGNPMYEPSIASIDHVNVGANPELGQLVLNAHHIFNLNVSQCNEIILNTTYDCGTTLITGCSALTALNLTYMTGDWKIQNCSMTQLELPGLSDASSVLEIDSNPQLTSISLSNMSSIESDLIITNNGPSLVLSFPMLETIGGEVSMTGDIQNINMPLLSHSVRGFSVVSTNPNFNCSQLDTLYAQNFIRGPYNCSVQAPVLPSSSSGFTYSTSLPPPSSLSHSSSTRGLSFSTKLGIGVGIGVAALAFFSGALGFWLKRRTILKIKTLNQVHLVPEVPPNQRQETIELEAHEKPQELLTSMFHQMPTEKFDAKFLLETPGQKFPSNWPLP